MTAPALFAAFVAQAAESDAERRVRTGGKLFRALLAADLDLAERVDAEGRLRVLIVGDDADLVTQAIATITGEGGDSEGQIGGLPLHIEAASELPRDDVPVGGLFVAVPFPDPAISAIADWGVGRRTVTYSPFDGHVEAGLLGGIAVEARVRPFINRTTLSSAGIRLKPFFIKVAKVHE